MPDTNNSNASRLNSLLTAHLFSYVGKPNTNDVRKQIFASIVNAYREYLTPQLVKDASGEA